MLELVRASSLASTRRDSDLGEADPRRPPWSSRPPWEPRRGSASARSATSPRCRSRQRRTAGEHSITRESELVVQAVATAVALPLAGSTYPDIKPLLEAAIQDDKRAATTACSGSWSPIRRPVVAADPGAPPRGSSPSSRAARTVKNGDIVHAHGGSSTDWVYGAPVKFGDNASVRCGWASRRRGSTSRARRRRSPRPRTARAPRAIGAAGVARRARDRRPARRVQGVQLAQPIKALTDAGERIAGGDLNSRVPESRARRARRARADVQQDGRRDPWLLVEQAQKASLEKEMSARAAGPAGDAAAGHARPARASQGRRLLHAGVELRRRLVDVPQDDERPDAARARRCDRPRHPLGDDRGDRARCGRGARGGRRAAADARAGAEGDRLRDPSGRRAQRADDRVRGGVRFGERHAPLRERRAELPVRDQARQSRRSLEDASIIAASGNPLGDRNIAVEIRRGSLQLRPGDLFVCFTDGVVERANPAGKLFGDRRLRNALTGQPVPDGGALISCAIRLAMVEKYAEGATAQDDITFVLCQYDPPLRVRGEPSDETARRHRGGGGGADSRTPSHRPPPSTSSDLPPLPAPSEEESELGDVLAAASAEEDVVVGAAKREQSLGNVAPRSPSSRRSDPAVRLSHRRRGARGRRGASTSRTTGSVLDRHPRPADSRRLQHAHPRARRRREVNEAGRVRGPRARWLVSIDDIARIEVIRGPVSCVYGTNAFFASSTSSPVAPRRRRARGDARR